MRKIHIEAKNGDEYFLVEWNYLIYSKDKLKRVRLYSPKWETIEIDEVEKIFKEQFPNISKILK